MIIQFQSASHVPFLGKCLNLALSPSFGHLEPGEPDFVEAAPPSSSSDEDGESEEKRGENSTPVVGSGWRPSSKAGGQRVGARRGRTATPATASIQGGAAASKNPPAGRGAPREEGGAPFVSCRRALIIITFGKK